MEKLFIKMDKIKQRKRRYQAQFKNEGVSKGKVWVKKANMWLQYECYNTPNKADKFEWE